MFLASAFSRKCGRERDNVPHYGGLLLGTLLLLFCFAARFPRYEGQHRDLQLTTAQGYLDGDPTGSETVIAALLLLMSFAIASIPVFAAIISAGPSLATVRPAPSQFNRELRVRPPPRK
jgi:hypothetical protein